MKHHWLMFRIWLVRKIVGDSIMINMQIKSANSETKGIQITSRGEKCVIYGNVII